MEGPALVVSRGMTAPAGHGVAGLERVPAELPSVDALPEPDDGLPDLPPHAVNRPAKTIKARHVEGFAFTGFDSSFCMFCDFFGDSLSS
jgi:hypothetical protein